MSFCKQNELSLDKTNLRKMNNRNMEVVRGKGFEPISFRVNGCSVI